MGKKLKMEEEVNMSSNIELDMESIAEEVKVEIPKSVIESNEVNKVSDVRGYEDTMESCLRKEKVIARLVPRNTDKYQHPKHVLRGGMAEGVVKRFTVPILTSGVYVNVLTDKEKAFLEYALGLEKNALSIYKKKDNFWDNFMVSLSKEDNYFDLSIPMDYIKYKVLLANTELICPNLDTLHNTPKATYKYVLFLEGEQDKKERQSMSSTMRAYKEFGKVEDDKHTLRVVLEVISQRPISSNVKLDWIHSQLNTIIQQNPKTFLKVIEDEYLKYKVLIKRAVDAGIISNRSGFYYYRKDNTPLCNNGEDANLSNASKYLASVANQELRFNIEAELNSRD